MGAPLLVLLDGVALLDAGALGPALDDVLPDDVPLEGAVPAEVVPAADVVSGADAALEPALVAT